VGVGVGVGVDAGRDEELRRFHQFVGVVLSSRAQFVVVVDTLRVLQRRLLRAPKAAKAGGVGGVAVTGGGPGGEGGEGQGEGLTPRTLAGMKEDDLAELIKSVHYNKAKAKHLVKASKMLLQRHKGRVPRNQAALLRLPGIGETLAELLVIVLNADLSARKGPGPSGTT
jgi:endonuclease III